jgi:hypothetical protein
VHAGQLTWHLTEECEPFRLHGCRVHLCFRIFDCYLHAIERIVQGTGMFARRLAMAGGSALGYTRTHTTEWMTPVDTEAAATTHRVLRLL